MADTQNIEQQLTAPAYYDDLIWVPMLSMSDGRLLLGNSPMTRHEAINSARAERKRLNSIGQEVRYHGVLDASE